MEVAGKIPSVRSSASRGYTKSARRDSVSTARMPSRTRWWTTSSSSTAGWLTRSSARRRANRGQTDAAGGPGKDVAEEACDLVELRPAGHQGREICTTGSPRSSARQM